MTMSDLAAQGMVNFGRELARDELIEHLKPLYEEGMERLREHSEEICFRVMKSRSEDKGNFGYLEGEDMERERKLAAYLRHLLWEMYSVINKKDGDKGCCDESCLKCHHPRYNFHSKRAPDHWCNERKEGWFCQEECECK